MTAEWVAGVFALCVVLIIGFLLGVPVGSCTQKRDSDFQWEVEAVKRGHGRHIIVDSLTGATQFQWRTDGK